MNSFLPWGVFEDAEDALNAIAGSKEVESGRKKKKNVKWKEFFFFFFNKKRIFYVLP